MIRTIQRAVACLGLLVILAGQLQAGIITVSSASTDMGSGFDTNLDNTINGMGLSSFPSLTATHDATAPDNSWVSSGTLTGDIDFDLGGSFLVDGFSFWNQNGGGPGFDGITGIQDVVILSSLDGSTFTSIPGAPTTFSQVPGDSLLPPEMFSFAPIAARHIRFQVVSNHGDSEQTGFAEVAFSEFVSQAIPEPASIAVWSILALVGLGIAKRRRRRAAM